MKRLNEKVVVVTGGSSGIGLATVKKCLNEGARVAVFDLADPTDAIAGLGENVIGFKGSVTNNEDLEKFYTLVNEKFGNVDAIVANAGNGKSTDFVNEDGASLELMLDVHVKGAFYTIQKSMPYLNNGASVVITSSNSGLHGFENLSAYSAAKAASASLARTLSRDLKHRSIRVNSVSPGFIDTPGHQVMGLSKEIVQQAAIGVNLADRPGRPEEIANVISFLVTDESSFIIGTNILADGGQIVL
ncbi:SDR family oxidoreductase [Acidaminobacter sp. JC074]|uniref:SDR family NAD(P)-dependent oxidoreductase n=1 Tax=Acidaminobacter sp. JC074 TaxID=2530199 RepID=UPI001F10465F|nr:SDR family oxidoreductase [Acidaminobacter sp. JC074]MCH4887648.1 SDR family oxidoreductase [Acidaminobacter sp. JC074]